MVGTLSTAGQPHNRPRRVNSFHELIANFYSLKTKKIPGGKLASGGWLGDYRVFTGVGIFV